jgi:SAM-dependent methyltransferase
MTVRDLRAAIVPPAMKARVETLAAENVEVKTLRLILGEPKIYEWAHSIGATTDPVLEAIVPPVPPRELRLLVAEPEVELFLWTGILDLDLVLTQWEKHGGAIGTKPAILDFGCGCGRLMRFLVPCAGQADLHAADVNKNLVAWCQANLKGVSARVTGVAPPLPHAAGQFDLVYSLSVLTHLPEDAIGLWLGELARVIRPGGILVATIHGLRALERIEREADLQRVTGLDPKRAAGMLQDLAQAKVLYLPYDQAHLERTQAGSNYGTTFLSEPHVRAVASSAGFEVLDVIAGGLRGWQDVVVARKR